MYRGTSFLIAHVVVGFANALSDFGRLILGSLFKFLGLAWDATRRQSFEEVLDRILLPYLPTLAAKRQKLLRADDYGVLRTERWSKELGYFIGRVLLPKLGSYDGYAKRHIADTARLIDEIIYDYQLSQVDSSIRQKPSAQPHREDSRRKIRFALNQRVDR